MFLLVRQLVKKRWNLLKRLSICLTLLLLKSIEPKKAADLPKLVEVLKQVGKEDPSIKIEINRAKRAKEDIPVWKVMKYYVITKECFTPFRNYPEEDLQIPAKSFDKILTITSVFSTTVKFKGGYHCFTTQELAQKYLTQMFGVFILHGVRQYYIPKGELYAEEKYYLLLLATVYLQLEQEL